MKRFAKVAALVLVAVLSLTVLVGCVGTKPADIDKYYASVGSKFNATIVVGSTTYESAKGKLHVKSSDDEYYYEYTDTVTYKYEKNDSGVWEKKQLSSKQTQENPLDYVAVSWKGANYVYSKDIKGFDHTESTSVLGVTVKTTETLVFKGNDCTATSILGTVYSISKVGSTKVSFPKVGA